MTRIRSTLLALLLALPLLVAGLALPAASDVVTFRILEQGYFTGQHVPPRVGQPITLVDPVYSEPVSDRSPSHWWYTRDPVTQDIEVVARDTCEIWGEVIPEYGTRPCLRWHKVTSYTPTADDIGLQIEVEITGNPAGYQWPVIVTYATIGVEEDPGWIEDSRVETKPYGQPGFRSTEESPAIAGNATRVAYRLTNPTDARTNVGVRVLDPAGNPVNGSSGTLTLDPGETVDRYATVDTYNRAYDPQGAPRPTTTYRVEALPTGFPAGVDDAVVAVQPRPVVLVHGYNSSWHGWQQFFNLVRDADPRLHAYAVGDGQAPGVMDTGNLASPGHTNTIAENAAQEAAYVDGVRRSSGASHVDVIAHSMGGLITRDYIHELMPASDDGYPVVGRLIQMGTPNMGSPCANRMMEASVISGNHGAFPQPATLELSTYYVDGIFNPTITQLRGVELSNLVGTNIPVPCGFPTLGDSVVPESSAIWTIPGARLFLRSILHTSMTADQGVLDAYVMPTLTLPHLPPGARSVAPTGTRAPTAAPAGGGEPAFAAPLLSVGAGQSVDLPLDVPAGSAFGATTIAPGVELVLLDPDGEVAAHAAANDSDLPVVGVSVEGHRAGSWTLRAINSSAIDLTEVPVSTWVRGGDVEVDVLTATRSAATGRVTARVTKGGAPATTAAVTARVGDGTSTRVETLLDDGAHADGAARDGVFGARLADLPAGGPSVVVVGATVPAQGSRFESAPMVEASGPGDGPGTEEPRILAGPAGARARVGATAAFSVATSGPVDSYRWQTRPAATGSWTEVAGADGARLTVPVRSRRADGSQYRVVLSGPGPVPHLVTSEPATLRVDRAVSRATLDVTLGRTKPGRAAVSVTAPGVTPTGAVSVYDGKTRIGTGVLSDGRVVVSLRPSRRGRHLVRALYSGSVDVAPVWSRQVVVTVRGGRHHPRHPHHAHQAHHAHRGHSS